MKFTPRLQQTRFDRMLRRLPAVFIVGPRQCGKSAMARYVRPDWTHVDLDRPADSNQVSRCR